MKLASAVLAASMCLASAAVASGKPPLFWNLISSTVTRLEVSKAGADTFGPNLTANDPDGAVDHDERLKLTGVESGAYDVRLTLKDGRRCLTRDVKIVEGKPFSLEDKDLVGCAKQ